MTRLVRGHLRAGAAVPGAAARRPPRARAGGAAPPPRAAAPVLAPPALAPAVARGQARAALLRVAAPLLRGRLDLGQEEVVVGPPDGDLLADELLDRLEAERARLVHQGDRLAARAGARRAPDAGDVVLRVLRQGPVDDVAHRPDGE